MEIGSTKLPRSGRTKLVCGMSCFFRVQLSLGQKKHLEFVIMSDIYIYTYMYIVFLYILYLHNQRPAYFKDASRNAFLGMLRAILLCSFFKNLKQKPMNQQGSYLHHLSVRILYQQKHPAGNGPSTSHWPKEDGLCSQTHLQGWDVNRCFKVL